MVDELIRAAANRDESAYRELYYLWYDKAYRVAKSVCGSKPLAEDALQEALVRFWRALPRMKTHDFAERYFMTIVANEARRMQARARLLPDKPLRRDPPESTEDAPHTYDEAFSELLRAVEALPEKLRSAVKLHYWGGFTEAETAQLLKTSLSSVKMRLSRGRAKLKAALEAPDEEKRTGGYRIEQN